MDYIPLENKISLINKYVQINILRNKGEAKHVDFLENEIFTTIIDDLKSYSEMVAVPEPPKTSLEPAIEALKSYQAKQADMRYQINTLMKSLENYQEEESDQESLGEIINKLRDLDKD